MDRYSRITNKNAREIVLLKSFPCAWGKCLFCDYTCDNSRDEDEIDSCNTEVLKQVSGEFGVLEVINSGSCFELTKGTLERISAVIKEKNIKKLFFESHWMYRNKLNQMRDFMGVEIVYKIGVETFDYEFREKYLNKHADFKTPEEVAQYFDSPCLMVGIKGQTMEMIESDIYALKSHFKLGTINVYTNNTTSVVRDETLISWFTRTYQHLLDDPFIEVLFENTDFGVGD